MSKTHTQETLIRKMQDIKFVMKYNEQKNITGNCLLNSNTLI